MRIILMFLLLLLPSLLEAQSLVKLRVGYAGGASLVGPPVAWATKEARLFEKNGLAVELVAVSGGATLVQAMLAGDIQFGAMAGSAPVAAYLAGVDMVQIMGIINRPAYVLVSRPEIRSLSDLKGKIVAVTRIGSSSDFLARLQLESAGLIPDKDVTILGLGSSPERLAAVEGRRIHAALLTHGEIFQAQKLGMSILSDLSQVLPYPFYGITAMRGYIQKNEREVRFLMRALTEAIYRMAGDKEFTLKVLQKYARVSDPEILENAYQALVRFQERIPYPSTEAMKTVIEEFARRDARARTLSPAVLIELRFVKELEESGFIKKLSGG